jgi:alpha-L-rhamnosidase
MFRKKPFIGTKNSMIAIALSSMLVLSSFPSFLAPNSVKAESNKAPLAPTGLLTNLLPAPLAVEDLTHPKFSWEVNDENKGEKQTAYQIVVATDPEKPASNDSVVWDSGKVVSGASSNVPYEGPPLKPATRYYWTVKTWDKDGQAGPFSQPGVFGTGVKDQWTGSSIWQNSNEYASWDNYTIESDITIESNAAGIKFRAKDNNNSYMWQFSAQKGALAPHVKNAGTWREIAQVPYPFKTGVQYHIKIVATGQEITTFVNGTQIDKRTLSDHMTGSIGFRHGGTESAFYDNVIVTSDKNKILYNEDFSSSIAISCGSVRDGRLYVGRSAECLVGASDNMAFFRKNFTLENKEISNATAYVTGQSPSPARQYVYKFFVNGDFVGVGPVEGYNGQLFYNAYDITGLLKQGKENALGAIAYTQQDKRFLAEVHVTYKDGSKQVIKTDETWETLNAHKAIRDAGSVGTGYYYAPSENINSVEYPHGFSTPDFDSSAWSKVLVKTAIPKGQLTGQPSQNLEEVAVTPQKVVDKGNGRYFIDFGHTVTGSIRLTIDSPEEKEVEIRLGEELTAADTVRYNMRTGNNYREIWKLKQGQQTLEHWGYRVFRYAEIYGLPEGLTKLDDIVAAVALRYPFNESASEFTSSDQTLNTVWKFSKDSIRDLNFDLYYDSTTRERRAYEADAYIQQLSHYALDREFALARISHEYLYDHETWPTEWKQISIMAAWQDYLYTGDKTSLEKNYEVLKSKAYDRFMTEDGLIRKSTTDDIVDWPDSMRDGYQFTQTNTVINAYNYRDMIDLAKIAEVLNKPEDVKKYTELAAKQKEGINKHLFDSSVNMFRDGLGVNHYASHANFFTVALGAATDENAKLASEYIASRGMVPSVYGAPFLLESLFQHNQESKAIGLLTSHEKNSWMNMIKLGAGSTMEAWDPSQKPNLTYSHPWAASPAYIIPREMFGIVPVLPAFEKFEVKPRPGQIGSAEIKVPTMKGTIETSFTQTEDIFKLTVKVPVNSTALVSVPAASKSEVSVDGEVKYLEENNRYIVYEVGSGKYNFVVNKEKVIPFAPDNLTVEPGTKETSNILTWKDLSNYEKGFRIERYEGGDWIEIASVPANATTYKDHNVEPEKQYSYRVSAFNDHGSNSSSIVSIYAVDVRNVAYKKPVTATKEEAGNEVLGIVDGNPTTRWSAEGMPQTVVVDLEDVYSINEVGLTPYQNRAYQYKVETSLDGKNYSLVVDRTANTEGKTLLKDEFATVNARYVRLTSTGAHNYTGGWVSFHELRIYGTKYELDKVTLNAAVNTVLPGEQVALSLTGTMTDQKEADLSNATIKFESNQPELVSFGGDGKMTIANYVNSVRSFDVWATVVLAGKEVKSEAISFTIHPTIEHTQQLLEDYEVSEKVRGPLVPQLKNSLEQALHHNQKGRLDQEIHHLREFLKHINNESLKEHVSQEEKDVLTRDVETLISLLEGKK